MTYIVTIQLSVCPHNSAILLCGAFYGGLNPTKNLFHDKSTRSQIETMFQTFKKQQNHQQKTYF